MAEDRRRPLTRKLKSGEITFGLREALILATIACGFACAAVYYHVR